MIISLSQLITPVSEADALQECLDQLTALGFSANSWQPGSRQRTLVQMFARMYSGITTTIADIASMGLNEYATGGWLELKARSDYDNEKFAAVTTQGIVTLTAGSNAPGPQSIQAGQLVFADSVYGYTYRNSAAFTLNASTTYTLAVEAEVAAANRDVPVGTITIMKTPIAGVSVSNPAVGTTGTWITRNGADAESDAALRARNRAKWGTLGIAPGMTYRYYAAMASPSVRRVYVDDQNPRGPGTINVYIAGDSGGLASTVITAVDNYMRGITDGFDRVGNGADMIITSAVENTVTVTADVYVLSQYNNATTQAAVLAALTAYFQALPIGGTRTSTGGLGFITKGALFSTIAAIRGVQNVSFTAPTVDPVYLGRDNVAVPAISLNYISV